MSERKKGKYANWLNYNILKNNIYTVFQEIQPRDFFHHGERKVAEEQAKLSILQVTKNSEIAIN